MSDEPLNGIIDESARRMTAEPATGGNEFRRRVLARIDAGDTPRRPWRAAYVLSPIAISVAVVIAMFVARGTTVRQKPDATAAAGATANHDAIAERAERAVGRAEQARPLQAEKGSSRLHVGAELAPPETVPPTPALTIDPLAVAPLTVDALAQNSLQIDRLDTIAPITVAPLDIGDAQRRFE